MNTTDLRAARRLAAAARNLTLAGLCLAAPSLAQQWVEAGDGAVARSGGGCPVDDAKWCGDLFLQTAGEG